MHSLAQESSGESGQMEEIPESLLQSSGSTNSNEFSNIPHILPRIGDRYQVSVSPFKPPVNCYQLGVAESLNFKGNKDENIEQRLIEGLSLPIMQISSFRPSVSVKEYQKTYVNGLTTANQLAPQELLSVVSVKSKTDTLLHQHDFFKPTQKRCVHDLSVTEHNIDASIISIKTNISRAEDTCTESTVTAKNMCGVFDYGIGQRRKRSKVSWKRVKKIKVDVLDPCKQSSGSICQNPLKMMHNIEDANSRSYMMVPGRSSAPWSKTEEDLFILGIYLFGKNFNAVKRFVQTKDIKDVLSYYYGMFFRTESYCRWAESRKTRSRKCIQGKRIFSGWRQQELLMRLLPHISDSSKDEVPEIMKALNAGRISMEEFVTKLKGLAGSEVLVQAVGIGKGKQDLTRALTDPAKANKVLSRCKIPVGKACSSLSTEDIIKFLTGDFRLSKAQIDDLFWEAVWPRLLARGWHSEQPENQVLFGLRQSLLFLIPGVQKFSRRQLTKGMHYFDSVSEVLSNVASGPRVLELQRDLMSESEGNNEILSTSENGEVEIGHVEHSHSYLQPRFYTNYSDSCMFTVVDTSLTSQHEKPPRIQRRVTLPLDDNSKMFQKAYLKTEDEGNSASHLTEQLQCCKCCLVENVFNSKLDKSTIIAISNEKSDEKIRLNGILEASNPDQNDVMSSSWEQRRSNSLSDCKDDTVNAGNPSWLDVNAVSSQQIVIKPLDFKSLMEGINKSKPRKRAKKLCATRKNDQGEWIAKVATHMGDKDKRDMRLEDYQTSTINLGKSTYKGDWSTMKSAMGSLKAEMKKKKRANKELKAEIEQAKRLITEMVNPEVQNLSTTDAPIFLSRKEVDMLQEMKVQSKEYRDWIDILKKDAEHAFKYGFTEYEKAAELCKCLEDRAEVMSEDEEKYCRALESLKEIQEISQEELATSGILGGEDLGYLHETVEITKFIEELTTKSRNKFLKTRQDLNLLTMKLVKFLVQVMGEGLKDTAKGNIAAWNEMLKEDSMQWRNEGKNVLDLIFSLKGEFKQMTTLIEEMEKCFLEASRVFYSQSTRLRWVGEPGMDKISQLITRFQQYKQKDERIIDLD